MAEPKSNTKSASKKAESKPRKVLTPAERIAKAEADLEALRAKAAEKATKQGKALEEKRAALVKQIADRQAKVDEIDQQLEGLGLKPSEPADTQDVTPEDSSS